MDCYIGGNLDIAALVALVVPSLDPVSEEVGVLLHVVLHVPATGTPVREEDGKVMVRDEETGTTPEPVGATRVQATGAVRVEIGGRVAMEVCGCIIEYSRVWCIQLLISDY